MTPTITGRFVNPKTPDIRRLADRHSRMGIKSLKE